MVKTRRWAPEPERDLTKARAMVKSKRKAPEPEQEVYQGGFGGIVHTQTEKIGQASLGEVALRRLLLCSRTSPLESLHTVLLRSDGACPHLKANWDPSLWTDVTVLPWCYHLYLFYAMLVLWWFWSPTTAFMKFLWSNIQLCFYVDWWQQYLAYFCSYLDDFGFQLRFYQVWSLDVGFCRRYDVF